MANGWLSTREACDRLGVTLRTLYRTIDEGALPCYQFGRVYRLKVEDVERFRTGGGDAAGVREPRRPLPPLGSGSQALQLPDS